MKPYGGFGLRNNIEQETDALSHSEVKSGQAVVTLSLADPRVEAFVSAHPEGLVFHHPAYLRALEEESGQQCLLLAFENEDRSLEAILPLFYTRGLSFNIGRHHTKRRLSSLPRTPVAGVLSTNPVATLCVVEEAMRLVQAEPGVHLQIKTTELLPDLALCGTTLDDWRPTYVLKLPQSEDRLQLGNARNRHNLKWAVNKAIKLGVTLREAESETDLRAWYYVYLHTMRRNAVPPRSYKFFLALWRYLRPRRLMRLLLAELNSVKPGFIVAGSVFLMGGSTVFYAFTGCSPEHARTHANDLILWNAIEAAWRNGYRYVDFGEVAEDHPELAQFKKKWGSEPRALHRYYYPAPHSSNGIHHIGRLGKLARQTWQLLPVPVTKRLGELIYRYL